jgi:zinc protease
VKAITRDDLSRFWKENFVANNAALVVAGDISMADLKALAEKSFGLWQQGTPARPAAASFPLRQNAEFVTLVQMNVTWANRFQLW